MQDHLSIIREKIPRSDNIIDMFESSGTDYYNLVNIPPINNEGIPSFLKNGYTIVYGERLLAVIGPYILLQRYTDFPLIMMANADGRHDYRVMTEERYNLIRSYIE